ncbi:MAG: thiamine phosphate synthase [Muribaculaceae bacterium]|nr:thiamine phosphate synthase [Muribaculaceae bacterium]
MLQFITNSKSKTPVIDQVLAVIDGGCRWIQIRMKDASDEEIKKVVEAVKPKCIETGSFLLLNDRVELAKELNVGGVHLGKEDMPVSKARMLLGPAAVIGVTANTYADIAAVSNLDIDYFGIGPYANTETKDNLSPLLGLDGIRDISYEMSKNDILIPHVAVGGIKLDDVVPLLEVGGVNGVAVSSAIAYADDIVKATKEFLNLLPHTDID